MTHTPAVGIITFHTSTPTMLSLVGSLPRGKMARGFIDAIYTGAHAANLSLDRRIVSGLCRLELSGTAQGSAADIATFADVLPGIAEAWGFRAYAFVAVSDSTDA